MKFCLNTTFIEPEKNNEIKNAIILLHGYGGDGKDISMLTLKWKRFLKNTIFLCPDAPELCKINPRGFQWFDLNTEDKNFILNESKKTKKYYPFDFELIIEINLKINCLEFQITIHNKTDIPMPINFGLHPYFNVSDFKNLEFIDNPLNCQNQEKNIISNTLDELTNINLGVDLLMYTSGRSAFRDKIFKRQVTLNHPYPFDLGVIWSDPPRRMICLEPWTSPRNSFVDGFRKIMIPSNDSKRLNASIQIKSLK